MAKTIRFNLQFGKYEQPVRNIDELQGSFNIDLILESFQNGLLQRWLEAHKEHGLLSKVKEIPGDGIESNFENIERLCKVFKPELSRQEIESLAYPFEFRKKEEKRLAEYAKAKIAKDQIIQDYHKEYKSLLARLIEKSENYQFLKTSVAEICGTYKSLFALNVVDLYNQHIYDYPLVILSLLGNNYARELLSERIGMESIYDDITDSNLAKESFVDRWKEGTSQPHLRKCNTEEEKKEIEDEEVFHLGKSKQEIYATKNCTPPFEYIPMKYLSYPDHVISVEKTTQDYWEKLVPNNKKCLIIDLNDPQSLNYINDKEREDGRLASSDVQGEFLIMDGLYYKSKNEQAKLIYMEL
jgi:hypothetical protein